MAEERRDRMTYIIIKYLISKGGMCEDPMKMGQLVNI
jgi:hypothetical protein